MTEPDTQGKLDRQRQLREGEFITKRSETVPPVDLEDIVIIGLESHSQKLSDALNKTRGLERRLIRNTQRLATIVETVEQNENKDPPNSRTTIQLAKGLRMARSNPEFSTNEACDLESGHLNERESSTKSPGEFEAAESSNTSWAHVLDLLGIKSEGHIGTAGTQLLAGHYIDASELSDKAHQRIFAMSKT